MPPGRPTELTPDVRDRIVNALRNGTSRRGACRLASISFPTFYRWLERAENPDDPDHEWYAEFRNAAMQAEGEFENEALTVIRAGWMENPKLAIEVLRRRHPQDWNVGVQRHVHTLDPGGGSGQSDAISDEERLAEMVSAYAQGVAEGSRGVVIEGSVLPVLDGGEPGL